MMKMLARSNRLLRLTVAIGLVASATPALQAQDVNIMLPIPSIEQKLGRDTFKILNIRGSRRPNDRTQRVVLSFDDSTAMEAKFAVFAQNGEAFNNVPRYEIAAYELQKLFLDESEFVVPPTLARAFNLDWYKIHFDPQVKPTFGKTTSVLSTLQYWLGSVTNDTAHVYNPKRFETDTLYARKFGNLNLLTYLIRHNDANVGNILISTNPVNPRLFSVDNGVAFNSVESDRGTVWRELRFDKVPLGTVERLRKITREDLERVLGVLAEWEIKDGVLVPAEKTPNSSAGRGVRKTDTRLQLGLTRLELDGVERRLKQLLGRVDSGRLKTF
jgi:hypothetical protein